MNIFKMRWRLPLELSINKKGVVIMATQIKVGGVGIHIDGKDVWKDSEGSFGASGKFLFRIGEDGRSYYSENGIELDWLRGKNFEEAVKSVL